MYACMHMCTHVCMCVPASAQLLADARRGIAPGEPGQEGVAMNQEEEAGPEQRRRLTEFFWQTSSCGDRAGH